MDNNQRRQRGRVAPFNTSPRWPRGYFEVLEELGVEEARWRFYAHWVRQFFNSQQRSRRRRDLGRVEIEAFLQVLDADPAVERWQVLQARDALQVYYEQFRGIALDVADRVARVAEGQPEDAIGREPRGGKEAFRERETSVSPGPW